VALPFTPNSTIPFLESNGSETAVPVWRTQFPAATDTLDLGRWTYDIKPQLELDGEALVAELLIARLITRAGWEAAWVDSFAGERVRTTMPPEHVPLEVPEPVRTRLASVRERRGRDGGRWDVLAFRRADVVFIESKGPGDRINANQREWFVAARDEGFSPECFCIVDWEFSNPEVAERVRLERRGRLKPDGNGDARARAKPVQAPSARGSRIGQWRPTEPELQELLPPDYQAAVRSRASLHGVSPYSLVMDNSLRRIRAGRHSWPSRNRAILARGLASGEETSPEITRKGERLLADLNSAAPHPYPDEALR